MDCMFGRIGFEVLCVHLLMTKPGVPVQQHTWFFTFPPWLLLFCLGSLFLRLVTEVVRLLARALSVIVSTWSSGTFHGRVEHLFAFNLVWCSQYIFFQILRCLWYWCWQLRCWNSLDDTEFLSWSSHKKSSRSLCKCKSRGCILCSHLYLCN